MNAEVRLDTLLQTLDPRLEEGCFVFCALDDGRARRLWQECLCLFREREGWSAVLEQSLAQREGLEGSAVFRLITLQVYSSLEAVGLTAAISRELSAAGISANVVAALNHDHVFVPESRADEALQLLCGLRNRAQYS
ncbi:ACT domain-containing protein [Microbulbifer guangxiensis]|uniref:ACT domain-containing protein n=1 Tax=Microbulbifer guangxiensis TaxID=2904249 RepID=UPI001F39938B|nr:ACT domain-containing protein [Microbulbifer guangxiensis]